MKFIINLHLIASLWVCWSAFGDPVGIRPYGKIGITQIKENLDIVRLWTANFKGELVTAQYEGNQVFGRWTWHNRGKFGAQHDVNVGDKGIAVVAWMDEDVIEERAYVINEDGKLWEYAISGFDDPAPLISEIEGPDGQLLSGYITAQTLVVPPFNVRVSILFAVTPDGRLWSGVRTPLTQDRILWDEFDTTFRYRTDRDLVSDKYEANGEIIISLFALDTSDDVHLIRFSLNEGWSDTFIGKPFHEINELQKGCLSLATSQNTFENGSYALYLSCTAPELNPNTVYIAKTTSPTGQNFSWKAVNLGSEAAAIHEHVFNISSVTVKAAIASGLPNDYVDTIDIYVMTEDNAMWRIRERDASYAYPFPPPHPPSVVKLGSPSDTGSTSEWLSGSPVAISWPPSEGVSTAFFTKMINLESQVSYLYGITAGYDYGNIPRWRALGSDKIKRLVADGAPRAEGMIDGYGGKLATAFIVRPGSGSTDFPWNDLMWSNNDGYDWNEPVRIPAPEPEVYDYQSDPTIAFTQDKKLYISAQTARLIDNDCNIGFENAGFKSYIVGTSDGINLNILGSRPPLDSDHPWIVFNKLTRQIFWMPGVSAVYIIDENVDIQNYVYGNGISIISDTKDRLMTANFYDQHKGLYVWTKKGGKICRIENEKCEVFEIPFKLLLSSSFEGFSASSVSVQVDNYYANILHVAFLGDRTDTTNAKYQRSVFYVRGIYDGNNFTFSPAFQIAPIEDYLTFRESEVISAEKTIFITQSGNQDDQYIHVSFDINSQCILPPQNDPLCSNRSPCFRRMRSTFHMQTMVYEIFDLTEDSKISYCSSLPEHCSGIRPGKFLGDYMTTAINNHLYNFNMWVESTQRDYLATEIYIEFISDSIF